MHEMSINGQVIRGFPSGFQTLRDRYLGKKDLWYLRRDYMWFLEDGAGILAPDVKHDHPRHHEDDSTGNGEQVEGEEYGIQEGNISGHHLREEKVKHGLPEKNDHDGNPCSRAVEVMLGIAYIDFVKRHKRVNQPGCD